MCKKHKTYEDHILFNNNNLFIELCSGVTKILNFGLEKQFDPF